MPTTTPTPIRYTPLQLTDYASDTLAMIAQLGEPGTGLRGAVVLAGVPEDAREAVIEIAHVALNYTEGLRG